MTLLRSTDDALHLLSEMPFGLPTTRLAWELKVLGLAVIFGYAFYKFAWSYRLFNYAAILIGAEMNAELARSKEIDEYRMGEITARLADRIEELEARRGEEEVTLGWLAEQLRTFVDLNPEFEMAVERLATWLARLDDEDE